MNAEIKLTQIRQFPIQQARIVQIQLQQSAQVREAVNVYVLPLQPPIAVVQHMRNVDTGMDGRVFTQKQCQRTGLAVSMSRFSGGSTSMPFSEMSSKLQLHSSFPLCMMISA